MKKKLIAISALAPLVCFGLADTAAAQGAIQPGTEFPAAPMSKGGFSLSAPTQVLAPAAAPDPAAAPPEPAPTKRRKRRR